MTAARLVGRSLSAGLAIVVGVVLTLHVAIVASYAGGSGEALAAVVLGASIVAALIAMWALARPTSYLARTATCLVLAGVYVVVFVMVV